MSDIKTHLQSALQTFIAGFLGIIVLQLRSGAPIQWTVDFWMPVCLSAIGAGVKVAIERFAPPALGGKK